MARRPPPRRPSPTRSSNDQLSLADFRQNEVEYGSQSAWREGHLQSIKTRLSVSRGGRIAMTTDIRLVSASDGGARRRSRALTEEQMGIWLAQTLQPHDPFYNLGEYLEISGSVDVELFR